MEPSARTNSSPMASASVGGFHGKASGSFITAVRPSLLRTSPFSSRMTREGMPLTLYLALSLFLRSRSENFMASHGCSPWYSVNAASSLSEEAKTTSKFLPLDLSSL